MFPRAVQKVMCYTFYTRELNFKIHINTEQKGAHILGLEGLEIYLLNPVRTTLFSVPPFDSSEN